MKLKQDALTSALLPPVTVAKTQQTPPVLVQTSTDPNPRWARPKEAAKYLRVSMSTLWGFIENDPHFPLLRRIGKRCALIDLNKIDEWVQGGK